MANKKRWVNIICDEEMKPYKIIVTDGLNTWEIPVSNSSIETCKRAAFDVYDVPKKHVLITQVMNDAGNEKSQ